MLEKQVFSFYSQQRQFSWFYLSSHRLWCHNFLQYLYGNFQGKVLHLVEMDVEKDTEPDPPE
jgi:hypothetical protein